MGPAIIIIIIIIIYIILYITSTILLFIDSSCLTSDSEIMNGVML